MLDKKVIEAWTGHPHLRVINNHDDFDAKLNRVLKEISNVLGLPQPIEEERKYIVRITGQLPECTESEITQTYLVADPDSEVRLRRRLWNGKPVYVLNSKKRVSPHELIETEQQINSNLYQTMLQQADPYRQPIVKLRRSFIWKGQYFELDEYRKPTPDLLILETKGITENENVKLPTFLEIVEDITGRKEFYNYNLAKTR